MELGLGFDNFNWFWHKWNQPCDQIVACSDDFIDDDVVVTEDVEELDDEDCWWLMQGHCDYEECGELVNLSPSLQLATQLNLSWGLR